MNLTQEQKAAAIEAAANQDGDIAVDAVWQAARSNNHPLHNLFPWNLEEAAIQHWRYIARKIVASCRVEITYKETTFKVPQYVRNPDKSACEQGYVNVFHIKDSEELAREALNAEIDRIESAVNRALSLARVFGLEKDFRLILRGIAGIREKVPSEERAA